MHPSASAQTIAKAHPLDTVRRSSHERHRPHPSPPRTGTEPRGGATTPRFSRLTSPGRRMDPGSAHCRWRAPPADSTHHALTMLSPRGPGRRVKGTGRRARRFISFVRLPGLPPAPGSQSDGVRQGGRSGIHAAEKQASRACPTRIVRPAADARPARWIRSLRPVPGTRRGDASVIRSTDERSGTSSRYRLGARHTRGIARPSRIPPPAKKQHPSPPGTARRSRGGATTPRFGRFTSPGRRMDPGSAHCRWRAPPADSTHRALNKAPTARSGKTR